MAGLAFGLGGSLILFLAFCLIRPHHNIVYAPRVKFSDKKHKPDALGKGVFFWIKKIVTLKEDEILEKTGLDALVYIKFVKLCRNIFVLFAIVGCAVIIPINWIFNRKNAQFHTIIQKDYFVLMTPIFIRGNYMIPHIVLSWLFTFTICYFLWTNYTSVIRIRRALFMSAEYQSALFMRTLMVTEIPKNRRTEYGFVDMMNSFESSRPIENVTLGKDVRHINRLLKQHRLTVLKLEKILTNYVNKSAKSKTGPCPRPQMKPYRGDQKYVSSASGKVDAMDYLFSRIQRLENNIQAARAVVVEQKTLPYGFVSYRTPEDCHFVFKNAKNRGSVTVELAPRPEDIIWENIILTKILRTRKTIWGNVLFAILTILWIAPNAFIGAFLSQLSRIGVLWPPFKTFINDFPTLFSIIQGIGAPLVTALIFLVLPMIMRKLSHWQGRVTKHDRERGTAKKLYIFFVFNNLFVFSVFSVVWGIIVQIIGFIKNNDDPRSFKQLINDLDIGHKLASSILGASSFWVMYILQVNLGAVLDLLQLFVLLWRGFQRHLLSPTPRQQIMWTAPQHCNFAAYYNWILFYSTIALSFAMVQPLVLAALAIYFTLDVLYKKYSLMYIFITKAETDGMFWPFLFNSMIFANFFGNAVFSVLLWVQNGWKYSAALLPSLLFLILFKLTSIKHHNDKFFYFTPTQEERNKMAALNGEYVLKDTSSANLKLRFINPVIDDKLMVPMVHSKGQNILPDIRIEGISLPNQQGQIIPGISSNYNTNYHGSDEELKPNEITEVQPLDGRIDLVSEGDLDYSHLQEIGEAPEFRYRRKEIGSGTSNHIHRLENTETGENVPILNPYANNPYNTSTSIPEINPYMVNSNVSQQQSLYPPTNSFPQMSGEINDNSGKKNFETQYLEVSPTNASHSGSFNSSNSPIPPQGVVYEVFPTEPNTSQGTGIAPVPYPQQQQQHQQPYYPAESIQPNFNGNESNNDSNPNYNNNYNNNYNPNTNPYNDTRDNNNNNRNT